MEVTEKLEMIKNYIYPLFIDFDIALSRIH